MVSVRSLVRGFPGMRYGEYDEYGDVAIGLPEGLPKGTPR